MSHAFYVYVSYGFTALASLVIIALTLLDGRARRRELQSLEHRPPSRKGRSR